MTEQSRPSRNRRKRRGFGPEIVRRLLPHRRPFLFVDRIQNYEPGEPPRLEAFRLISQNESVFEGHFPDWAVWPGIYTIEGLGQCAQLLAALEHIHRRGVEVGDAELGLRTLQAIDASFGQRPGLGPEPEGIALLGADEPGTSPIGFSTRVDVRLLAPVFAGDRLDYRVELRREEAGVLFFSVNASVGGRTVARGELGASSNVTRPAGLTWSE